MPRNSSAFTRLELLAVLAALALLALCAWPALAGSRADAQRAGCFSNLRQIGQGAQRWAGDHGERIPWLTPVADGGTYTNVLHTSAVWLEMLTFSNELASPRLLACPADEGVKVASTWLGGAGALTTTGYRHNSVSYLMGLHTLMDTPGSLLVADRNVRASRVLTCGAALVQASSSLDGLDPAMGWTNAVHGTSGHQATIDGAVSYTGPAGWRESLYAPGSGNTIDFAAIGGPAPRVHTLRDR